MSLTVALDAPASARLGHAFRILEDGKESCDSFLSFYEAARASKRGAGSHSEQDLLRAMVVFAGATVDATMRIAVREVLPDFVEKDSTVRARLKTLVKANLKGEDNKGVPIEFAVVLNALFQQDLQPVVASLSNALTSKGVQDKTRAERMLKFVKVDLSPLWSTDIENALKARNEIVHELDARWSVSERRGVKNRVQRRRDDMVKHAEELLKFANAVLAAIDTEHGRL